MPRSRFRTRDLGKPRNARGGLVDVVGRTTLFTARAKVGATAGWVVGAADNTGTVATLPAAQTGSTLVVYLDGLKVGSKILGGHVVGQIESAGNTATLLLAIRKLTAAAADPTDAQVTVMAAALSVTADTLVSITNTSTPVIEETVAEGAVYYALITSTTAAATDIQVLGVGLTVVDEPDSL